MKKITLLFILIILSSFLALLAQTEVNNENHRYVILQNFHQATVLVIYDKNAKQIFENIVNNDMHDWKVRVTGPLSDRECNITMRISKEKIKISAGPKNDSELVYEIDPKMPSKIIMGLCDSIIYHEEHHFDKKP